MAQITPEPSPLHSRRVPGLAFRSLSSPSVATHGSYGPLTPLSLHSNSPLRSATIPSPQLDSNGPRFVPRRDAGDVMSYSLNRARKVLSSRIFWIVLVLLGLVYSWTRGGWHDFDPAALRSTRIARGILGPDVTAGLQFFPANNPKIHVGDPFFTSCVDLADQLVVCREVGCNPQSTAQGWNILWFVLL